MINLSIHKILLQSGKGYSFRLVQEVTGCATAREIQVRFQENISEDKNSHALEKNHMWRIEGGREVKKTSLLNYGSISDFVLSVLT